MPIYKQVYEEIGKSLWNAKEQKGQAGVMGGSKEENKPKQMRIFPYLAGWPMAVLTHYLFSSQVLFAVK